jgi:hypothetical protein
VIETAKIPAATTARANSSKKAIKFDAPTPGQNFIAVLVPSKTWLFSATYEASMGWKRSYSTQEASKTGAHAAFGISASELD